MRSLESEKCGSDQINARDDLSECTESSHGNYFSGYYAADLVISLGTSQGLSSVFLVAEGDLLVLSVDVFYIYIRTSPTLTTSDGCLILSQDSSEM